LQERLGLGQSRSAQAGDALASRRNIREFENGGRENAAIEFKPESAAFVVILEA
jgi:hypothetical protein